MAVESQISADKIDILEHILDSNHLEFFGAKIYLPQLHVGGYDLSITKHVVMMWVAALLVGVIFIFISRKKSPVPHGARNLLEAVLLFIRDEIAVPNMGHDASKFLPYLWTVFFFILFCNLLGLVPFGATATGNLSVTATLAACSFFMIHFSGMRKHGVVGYLNTIVPPVPFWLWPLMLVVEIIGHVAKPFALAVRLFANMIAGHIVILVIIGFIFLFKNVMVAGISVAGGVALALLEMFVALIQAYVFTFLTAVFIGIALHAEH